MSSDPSKSRRRNPPRRSSLAATVVQVTDSPEASLVRTPFSQPDLPLELHGTSEVPAFGPPGWRLAPRYYRLGVRGKKGAGR